MTHARIARSLNAVTPARMLGGLLLGGALVLGGTQAVQAAGHAPAGSAPSSMPCDDGYCPLQSGGHGHMGEHHGGRHGGHQGHGMKRGDKAAPLGGPGFDRLLNEVKATDAQRKQIRDITEKARADVRALQEKARAQHHDAMAIWTSPKLDAAEAEKARQQMLAHHDQVSKRMMQAMLDVGQVLTPEQRAQAAALIKQRHERMQARHGERQAERQQRREAREGDGERLQNHMLRRPAPAASQAAPSR